jgi:hypothetical protein
MEEKALFASFFKRSSQASRKIIASKEATWSTPPFLLDRCSPRVVQRAKLKQMKGQRTIFDLASEQKLRRAPIIEPEQCKKSVGEDLRRGKKQSVWRSVRLGGGKQIKAKGGGKGGWQPVKCDDKSGSVR